MPLGQVMVLTGHGWSLFLAIYYFGDEIDCGL